MDGLIFDDLSNGEIIKMNEKHNSSNHEGMSTKKISQNGFEKVNQTNNNELHLSDEASFSSNPSDYDIGKVIGKKTLTSYSKFIIF